jgi:hypothetical protein
MGIWLHKTSRELGHSTRPNRIAKKSITPPVCCECHSIQTPLIQISRPEKNKRATLFKLNYMKSIAIILFAIGFSFGSRAQSDPKTIKEIETVCNYYLDGGTNGDSLLFSKAFYPEGLMLFMRNDSVQIVSLKDFMARARNNGTKSERQTKIERIEIFGDAALATIRIENKDVILHDIMSLLKTKEGWKIAGKIFSREAKK